MEASILNKNYDALAIIDTFVSFLWTERYRDCGDFEIHMPVDHSIMQYLEMGNYIYNRESERLMLIEDIEIATDHETGNMLTISGRSLESILDRRIVWGQKVLTGNFQSAIYELLRENIISPSITSRIIPNFTMRMSTDPRITELTIDIQFFGDNLLEAIVAMCSEKDVGFKILPSGAGGFVFELYKGIDRSYEQEAVPWIVFSPKYDNLLESAYIQTFRALKTATLAGGEGEGANRKVLEVDSGATGLERREFFTDASDISTSTDDGTLTDADYEAQLREKGLSAISETQVVESFEGEVLSTSQFVYGVDFFIGDIVQIVNEYGMQARSYISEFILSQNLEGTSMIPTFTAV